MPQSCKSGQSWCCSMALQLPAAVCCRCTIALVTAPNKETGALQASESRFQKDMRTMETRLEGAQAEVSTSRQVRARRTHTYRTGLMPLHACSSRSPAMCQQEAGHNGTMRAKPVWMLFKKFEVDCQIHAFKS